MERRPPDATSPRTPLPSHPLNGGEIGEKETSKRHYDSPVTAWSWWLGPLALLAGLTLALFASLLVDIPAAILGAHVSSGKPPGGIVLIDTALQDAIFVATAVMLARTAGQAVSSAQFGLRPTPFWRAVGAVVLMLIAFYLVSVIWSELVHSKEEKLLEELGANEATALLIGSAALTCVIAPICEELLFRGFIFTALRNWRGPWLAAVLTGLLFGAVHAFSAPVEYLLPLAVLGFALCLLYRATGSIYPCIAAHAVNNSIAFGALEGWGWQVPVLLACSLGGIWGLVQLGKRVGLIALGGAPGGASVDGGTGIARCHRQNGL